MTRHTIPAAIALAVTLHLAGCDKTPAPETAEAGLAAAMAPSPVSPASITPAPAKAAAPAATARGLPGPTDRDPAHALAFWRAAMEARDWTAARSVFGESGAQSGMSARDFAAAWDKYRIVDVTIGPGEQDAGAGSVFYEAPVTITGLTTANKPYHLAGKLSLRRINDVGGASAEQLRWHIERSTLRP